MRVRIIFITEPALNEAEARALTSIARVCIPEIDQRAYLATQINYIRRPLWVEHPDRDVLGDIPTIGRIKGTHDTSRRSRQPGAHSALGRRPKGTAARSPTTPTPRAPCAASAAMARCEPHVKAAVWHLLRANPVPEVMSFDDHSSNTIAKLQSMIAQHREVISDNLVRNGRSKHVVDELLAHTNPSWALWCLNHQGILHGKTIRLIKEERPEGIEEAVTHEAIFARVERTIERAFHEASANDVMAKRAELEKQLADMKEPAADLQQRMANMRQRAGLRRQLADLKPPVTLLVAPPGSRKSTLARAKAVRYVTEHPNKTVVIAVPLHKLGAEQIEMLREEHPLAKYRAGVWRGRHADDPLTPDLQHPGKFLKMCQRGEDVTLVEDVMVDPDHLCIRGRGEKAIKCPLYDGCAFQVQKRIKANIWFLAHECLAHEMPKVLGDVGWVIVDENPIDAFVFGVDRNDPVTLGLDTLHTPLQVADEAKLGVNGYGNLMEAREELHHALDKLQVPAEFHQGAPVPRQSLKAFNHHIPTGYFITTKNPLFAGAFAHGEILHGDFTDEIPDLDAVRDKYFKTDPKPFIDAHIAEYNNDDFDEELMWQLEASSARFNGATDDTEIPAKKAAYAAAKNDADLFIDARYGERAVGFPAFHDMHKLTLRGKFNPEIWPDMSTEQLKNKLAAEAAGNTAIKLEAKLWGTHRSSG